MNLFEIFAVKMVDMGAWETKTCPP